MRSGSQVPVQKSKAAKAGVVLRGLGEVSPSGLGSEPSHMHMGTETMFYDKSQGKREGL